jgi:N-acetyl-anhydromuramyl-L-alanine amidase AmpD
VAGVPFAQAKHYRWGRRGHDVLWLVVHSAECAETGGAAEALQSYAATMPDDRRASWHYAVDCDSVTQSVREADTAFHAPPCNDVSIGIECAGRANQLAGQWDDEYSRALVRWKLVPLAADVCSRHRIPVRLVDAETLTGGLETARRLVASKADSDQWLGLRSLAGGIVTHAQIARAFKKSDHYDPGAGFPLADFFERVKAATPEAA